MVNWAYVAGFFDGEGSISHQGSVSCGAGQIGWQIRMAQAEPRKRALDDIGEFLNKEGVKWGWMVKRPKDERHDIVYNISISGRDDVLKFIEGVMPFCIAKKPIAQDVWRFLRFFPSLRKYTGFLAKEGYYAHANYNAHLYQR